MVSHRAGWHSESELKVPAALANKEWVDLHVQIYDEHDKEEQYVTLSMPRVCAQLTHSWYAFQVPGWLVSGSNLSVCLEARLLST